ncbi:hypothetical protein ACJ2_11090 [Pantoea sp. QMID2]|nr:hypothetical protein ACJ1_18980 [Pantoea sp. QMID1]GME38462.1 hypothetical protein ACJ3_21070 [Pantoea sp. QMID3]GME53461.1 hypothetical protein ACJ4_13060 [Pantoea sp. QMID4]GME53927.1 hypothetical protein ACJ2_11090 [Pantoea sp. QMID2]
MQKETAPGGAVKPGLASGKIGAAQGTQSDRKDAKAVIHDRSARAITHLIPEVRPYKGQRFASFKNAPGVFIRAAGRFPPLPVFPAR